MSDATRFITACAIVLAVFRPAAQSPAAGSAVSVVQPSGSGGVGLAESSAAAIPSGYVIGADDVLSIVFWREKDMSSEVTVRPDGRVTLPLLNDIVAAGLTPEQLRDNVAAAAKKFVEDPNPTVIVKEINSRRVFITGQVEKSGPYPLNSTTTLLQLIAMAGGLREFAQGKNITLLRHENGRQVVYSFNYRDVLNRKNLDQNIELKPGDTVVVP